MLSEGVVNAQGDFGPILSMSGQYTNGKARPQSIRISPGRIIETESEGISPLTDEPKLKVYLAARYSRKNEIKEKANELEGLGITVTSRWLDEVEPSESGCLDGLTDSYIQKVAVQDVEDIDVCDVLVLFSEDPKVPHVRGGRHFETGYAYGKGIPVIVCGPVENVFHRLSRVIVVDSWDELKANLRFLGKVKLI